MSWQDFNRLIDERNTDITAWMTAIRANPNTPEDALKVALLNMIQREDGEMLEKLTEVVIALVRNADALLDALMERDGFPVAIDSEPVMVIGLDDPREDHAPDGYLPDFGDLEFFDADDDAFLHGGNGGGHGGNGASFGVGPTALPF